MALKALSTVVVPVRDQDAALTFYTDVLGLEKISDFTYDTGERWLEVAPPGQTSRPDETGIAICSDDIPGDLARFRERGARVDDAPLVQGEVMVWADAPLAGYPPQFRVWDPDGNSRLIVATVP